MQNALAYYATKKQIKTAENQPKYIKNENQQSNLNTTKSRKTTKIQAA